MRRLFRNSTAIAACLALLAPNIAAAQAPAEAEAQPAPPAEQPEPAASETDELTDAPAEVVAPEEPEGENAENEAPVNDAAAEVDEPSAVAAPEAVAEPTETDTAPTGDAATADPVEDGTGLDDAAEAETDALEPTEETAAPADSIKADGAVIAPEVAPSTGEVTDGNTDAQTSAAPAQTQPDNTNSTEATPDAAEEAASPSDMTDLDAAMQAEEDTQVGAATASDTTEAEAPASEAAVSSEARTTQTTGAQGQSSVAAEAAQATQAPSVTALDDNATSEVTEEAVTEENSRSSSEDFATTMRDAVSAGADTATRNGRDADNDLTKALLLGLGGIAVGAMLNNHRQVQLSTPDRIVVTRQDGTQELIKDDVALLRQPGSTVATENFDDGSSRTIVTRADGSRVVTIRDANLRVLRRTLVSTDGRQTMLIDETIAVEPVDIASLPRPAPAYNDAGGDMDEASLREALMREAGVDRRFSLAQIRDISQVRSLVAPIDVNGITFETNSAAINADQAKQLTALGRVIRDAVEQNPGEIFLIEGHTDTVGDNASNLALSDRRAESVALALTEYFQVAPENMVVQGYGKQSLKIQKEGDIRENRRVAVRRITDLLQTTNN